ncbi:MAG: class I SAM-dependent methyltransferase [Candidatus Thermoplasmatota archaeon]
MKMKKDAERASETFDSIAEHFDKTRNRPWEEVMEFLEDLRGKLLDMGCGNGRHLIEALEMGFDVVGIDASTRLLQISTRKVRRKIGDHPKGEVIRADVKRLPFKEKSFDNAIYIATIHHLKRGRVKSLREAKRVLKPGGSILVSSWARELDRWEMDEGEREVIVPWHREDGKVIERFYHLYTLDELERDVKKSNLKVVKAFHSEGNNYVEAVKK